MLVASHQPCNDCGSSDALAEYSNKTYCFSCHKSTYTKQSRSMALQMEDVVQAHGPLELPKECTSKITPQGMKWLWSCGIKDEQIAIYGIKYCPYGGYISGGGKRVHFSDRIILPKYNDDKLIFYQARALTKGDDPKYHTVGPKQCMFRSKQAETDYIVLVEDIMSAIRVGEVATSISLLGTKINTRQLLTLAENHVNIIVWLDGDKAGLEGSRKLKGLLSLVTNVAEIKTEKDPKCYTTEEIEVLISDALKDLDTDI